MTRPARVIAASARRAAPPARATPPTPGERADREAAAALQSALARGDARRAVMLCAARYGPALARFCRALLGSERQAEELTLHTLLAAVETPEALRQARSPRAFLFGLARERCLARLQRRTRAGAARGPSPATSLAATDRGPEPARALLARAELEDRALLALRYVAGLRVDEVAAAAGGDVRAVTQRLSRCLVELSQALWSERAED